MKIKVCIIFTLTVLSTLIYACSGSLNDNVESIDLSWTPKGQYLLGEEVLFTNVSIIVNYKDENKESIAIELHNSNINIEGTGILFDPLRLKTDRLGEYEVLILFGNSQVRFDYLVVDSGTWDGSLQNYEDIEIDNGTYKIYHAAEWATLAHHYRETDLLDARIKIMDDIDFSGHAFDQIHGFSGTIEGLDNEIKILGLNQPLIHTLYGLPSAIPFSTSTTIKNLIISSCYHPTHKSAARIATYGIGDLTPLSENPSPNPTYIHFDNVRVTGNVLTHFPHGMFFQWTVGALDIRFENSYSHDLNYTVLSASEYDYGPSLFISNHGFNGAYGNSADDPWHSSNVYFNEASIDNMANISYNYISDQLGVFWSRKWGEAYACDTDFSNCASMSDTANNTDNHTGITKTEHVYSTDSILIETMDLGDYLMLKRSSSHITSFTMRFTYQLKYRDSPVSLIRNFNIPDSPDLQTTFVLPFQKIIITQNESLAGMPYHYIDPITSFQRLGIHEKTSLWVFELGRDNEILFAHELTYLGGDPYNPSIG